MRYLCVVVLFSALIAVSAAELKCAADAECQESGTKMQCFCLKGRAALIGTCKCNMDPKVLNECVKHSDCSLMDTKNGARWCGCIRNPYYQAKGQCDCINYLG